MKGWCGKILFVNLSKRKIKVLEFGEEFSRNYLGGNGFGAKLLFEHVKKGVEPFSSENYIFFVSGPLSGTLDHAAGRLGVITKSPLTGLFMDSYLGGNFGAELKYAGFDVLAVSGKSKKPVFLKVTNDEVELSDAKHLWGKNIIETQKIIHRDEGKDYKVIGIGQGGERLVRFACTIAGTRAAGRGGTGAIMGSKNLKCLAIFGDNGVAVSDLDSLLEFYNAKIDEWEKNFKGGLSDFGTPVLVNIINNLGGLGTKNWQEEFFEEAEEISGELLKEKYFKHHIACFGCRIACSKVFEGKCLSEGPEYETLYALGSCCGVTDLKAIIEADRLCDEYSLDTISTGVSIAFGMEAFERGFLTERDTDGLDFKFGNSEALIEAIHKIARREGFGNFLSEGSRRMAQKLKVDFNMDVRGLELAGHSPRALKSMALSYAVSPRGGSHHDGRPTYEYGLKDKRTIEGKARISYDSQNWTAIGDSMIICHLVERVFGYFLNENHLNLIKNVTGWNLTLKELNEVAERIINLERAFNVREGIRRKDDVLPKRIMFEEIPKGSSKGCIAKPQELEMMKDEYYEMRGWDSDGVPTQKRLKELGLDWVEV
ncbi:MAG: aldehyde ferredoxin oxidoreductase family protein [Candidatus Methanofastidiosia archaeon]